MVEICDEIGEYCNSFITPSQDGTKKINILGLESTKEIFKDNIEVEIKKLGL
jgi:hypothetical protein